MTNRIIFFVLVSAGLVLTGVFVWSEYGANAQRDQSEMRSRTTVATAKVEAETWTRYLPAVGSLTAVYGIDVTTEVTGQVTRILFESGEEVQQGDLLLQLDDTIDRADLDRLETEKRLAELKYRRRADLYEENLTAREDYDEARATFENASARVRAQRERVRKKKIRAPFAGSLGIRQVDLGEYLEPGAQIVSLRTLDPIYVDYSLPQQHFSQVSKNQRIEVHLMGHPERTFEGRVIAIEPGIDAPTRSFRVRGRLENSDGKLRPGMFVRVKTVLDRGTSVLTVPRTAITQSPYGDSVFRVEEEQGELVVRSVIVETGEVRDGTVEIVDGVKDGEQVVRAGQLKLESGERVRIDNSVKLQASVLER